MTGFVLRLFLGTVSLAFFLDPDVSLEAVDTNDEEEEQGVDPPEYVEEADEHLDECDWSITARCSSSMESSNDLTGGNSASMTAGSFPRRLCAKCGIVAIRGERAQGFVDVRSCSSVGSIKLQ